MRQVTMATLLVSILMLTMQCSENESLNSFNGRMETVSAPITKAYSFAPYNYQMHTDSTRWVNEFPPGGPSSVSIILSGQIETDSNDITGNPVNIGIGQNHIDLAVETHTGSVPGIVHLAFDSIGGFLDTLLIASSPLSGLILAQSTRLFVKKVNITPDPDTLQQTFDTTVIVSDTIQLVNPHFDTMQVANPHTVAGQ
jgi:hypothetical protein